MSSRSRAWPPNAREGVYTIHRWKTAALIRTCVRAGAILAGASPQQLQDLTRYGEHLGLAFQIIDDVLDTTADSATLGKTAGKDAKAGKLTYPSVIGVDRSRRMALALKEEAFSQLNLDRERGAELASLIDACVTRER